MNSVMVNDRDEIIMFSEFVSELVVLQKGEVARTGILEAVERSGKNEGLRDAFVNAAMLPIFLPADRNEVRERACGLIQSIGTAVGRALQERGKPGHWGRNSAEKMVAYIFCDAFSGDVSDDTSPSIDDHAGVERICLRAGKIAADIYNTVFSMADYEEHQAKLNPKNDVRHTLVGYFMDAFLQGFNGEFIEELSSSKHKGWLQRSLKGLKRRFRKRQ